MAAETNLLRLEANRTVLSATLQQMRRDRPKRQQLHESAYARLLARLDSLPVIEQAKGILMAESGCDPDEAFDMLRLASQRTNVKVRDLASGIVERAVQRGRQQRARDSVVPLHRRTPRAAQPPARSSLPSGGAPTAAASDASA
jgi:hypothetical protein